MSNLVLGKKVFFELSVDSEWFPIFCAKDASLDITQEELEITTVNSSRWREFITGMKSAQISVSGITTLNNTGSRVSIFYLIQPGVIGNLLNLRMRMEDENGDLLALTFSAIITSANISRSIAAFSQSGITFKMSGGFTLSSDIAPPTEPVCEVQTPLYLELNEGDTSVQDDLLKQVGVEILTVGRDGGYGYAPTSGTPGDKEYHFNATTGIISFDATNPAPSGGQPIYILYKIVS